MTIPNPLTPERCNLQDFKFMPVDVRRLLTSETWVLGTPAERASAMALWLESWHQVPAGSLPNNDRMLAHLSQSKDWQGEREHVMRGWLLCSDGRYYHPVVAEKALESWVDKLLFKISSTNGNASRWDIDLDVADIERECVKSLGLLRNLAPSSRIFKKKAVVRLLSIGIPPDSASEAKALPRASVPESNPDSGAEDESIPPASASDPESILRDRDRERDTKKHKNLLSGKPDDADADEEREPELDMSAADPVAEVIGYLNDRAGTAFRLVESNARLVRARLKEGATVSDMRAVIDAKSREWPSGDKMRKYLRPSTLFGAENFAQYVGQLIASTPAETDAPFWVRAGFPGRSGEWDARNAGVTEKNAKYWRNGRPLIKIPGANVEPWPEGTYERP